jgi:hypothetical protein
MTYNFDPERWYASHRAVLEARRERGELDDQELEVELAELEHRYEELVERLDRTYEIPPRRPE